MPERKMKISFVFAGCVALVGLWVFGIHPLNAEVGQSKQTIQGLSMKQDDSRFRGAEQMMNHHESVMRQSQEMMRAQEQAGIGIRK
ncbi:MAG: hypothetical protein A3G33_09065 [Omnitrophica bacterium RIFCSPLOWO2_12_FULL_44_17]|uniref:Uncharacterized protein n=1 Tax=Candidatus Danuiimicrobium aquiferis TaxID=1801832 RepID=A0A1G1L047_9BACT|nr:MAG: hypothetical protein A3B72_00155 [Omnitrophica bacterium RIFCSPHIGHO2_02_FULL_45_28]OGW91610.1 MAG: hypothetical protein A3E74_05170 [Omnitrophica bacterium RIFCSPHIGHO2_12_FULL_44_12]OGW98523.1 MAG: hypothetical protein A3G33_09065 [Omnitrophica bacterium RIFCSPLOWO2_12_FULL_44_17]OGX05075.1 MAG: hypothetical protein A3J12_08945 [Omnitrophica bacterium RIFCSPLOWO2_02_FULL_44_11]